MEFDNCKANKRYKFGRYFRIEEIDLPDIDFFKRFIDEESKKHPSWKYHISKHLKPDLKHVLYFTVNCKTRKYVEMYGRRKIGFRNG